ncbi:MAG TPA: hypothetical protein DGR97_07820 [Gammaproteobacteria bacterium]|nr:hypothetical protein [Gammaproteobacteria bacterium]|tara:strand:- start:4635 stop:5027 length:393 start_codon:yes stop_codon:yes gene_type:complete
MSRDWPAVDEIIRTVEEFLGAIANQLDGRDRYDALCARYLLNVARRELSEGAEIDERELNMLEAFLEESGSLKELQGKLGQSIRAGTYDEKWQQVFDLVMTHVTNNVMVSRPDKLESEHRGDSMPTKEVR